MGKEGRVRTYEFLAAVTSQQRPSFDPDLGVITPPSNGMARSVFARPVAPRANWRRRYVAWLVLLDVLAALAASRTVVALLADADAGFWDQRVLGNVSSFSLAAFVGVPVGWLIMLVAAGAYDQRALGLGTEELKRVARASLAMAAAVSFLALGFKKDLSRATVAAIIICLLLYTLVVGSPPVWCCGGSGVPGGHRRRCCWSARLADALDVHAAVTRNSAAGLARSAST